MIFPRRKNAPEKTISPKISKSTSLDLNIGKYSKAKTTTKVSIIPEATTVIKNRIYYPP
jgi:hypothetical protein